MLISKRKLCSQMARMPKKIKFTTFSQTFQIRCVNLPVASFSKKIDEISAAVRPIHMKHTKSWGRIKKRIRNPPLPLIYRATCQRAIIGVVIYERPTVYQSYITSRPQSVGQYIYTAYATAPINNVDMPTYWPNHARLPPRVWLTGWEMAILADFHPTAAIIERDKAV